MKEKNSFLYCYCFLEPSRFAFLEWVYFRYSFRSYVVRKKQECAVREPTSSVVPASASLCVGSWQVCKERKEHSFLLHTHFSLCASSDLSSHLRPRKVNPNLFLREKTKEHVHKFLLFRRAVIKNTIVFLNLCCWINNSYSGVASGQICNLCIRVSYCWSSSAGD